MAKLSVLIAKLLAWMSRHPVKFRRGGGEVSEIIDFANLHGIFRLQNFGISWIFGEIWQLWFSGKFQLHFKKCFAYLLDILPDSTTNFHPRLRFLVDNRQTSLPSWGPAVCSTGQPSVLFCRLAHGRGAGIGSAGKSHNRKKCHFKMVEKSTSPTQIAWNVSDCSTVAGVANEISETLGRLRQNLKTNVGNYPSRSGMHKLLSLFNKLFVNLFSFSFFFNPDSIWLKSGLTLLPTQRWGWRPFNPLDWTSKLLLGTVSPSADAGASKMDGST